mgnify:CR=1 FL=1
MVKDRDYERRLITLKVVLLFLSFFFLMIRRPPRSTQSSSSAASDVYKRQLALEREPIAVVDQSVEDRVCDRRVLQIGVPLLDRDLALSLIHISEPTRLLSTSYAAFCLTKKIYQLHP